MRAARATALTAASAAALTLASPGGAARRVAPDPNPCVDPVQAAQLLCPKLSLDKPRDMYFDRSARRGRVLLRARNSINSRGLGPIEFRGKRTGPNTMDAFQKIYRRDGGAITLNTGARLGFQTVPGQYRY